MLLMHHSELCVSAEMQLCADMSACTVHVSYCTHNAAYGRLGTGTSAASDIVAGCGLYGSLTHQASNSRQAAWYVLTLNMPRTVMLPDRVQFMVKL
jgi:hypothetical protein